MCWISEKISGREVEVGMVYGVRHEVSMVALLLAGVVSGCGADDASLSPESSFQREDSAGVTILSSRRAEWGPGEGWRVSNEPALQIGSVEGDSASEIFDVEDAVRLSDGRLVVAAGTNEIRYFGPDGELLDMVGGRGDGPGEYRTLVEVQRMAGDSLLAFDLIPSRVTLLDETGMTVRTVNLTGDGENRLITGSVVRMEDGRFFGIDTWSTGQVADQAGPGLYRPNAFALRFAANGTLEDTVVAYPSADMARRSVEGRTLTGLPPFARITTTAVRDRELYVGTGESLDVRVYDFSGRLVRILRGPTPDLTITSEEVEERKRAELEGVEDPDAIVYLTAKFEATPLPETKPAYVEMLVDPLGNLWLSPFDGGTGMDDPWTVFGSDGRLLGSVALPTSIDVVDIDEEYVVAVWRDELDVEYIRLYAIER